MYISRDAAPVVSRSGVSGLYPGQEVKFDVDGGNARDITPVVPRHAGSVIEFAGENGLIQSDSGAQVSVHHTDIEGRESYKSLRRSEPVEFEMAQGSKARHVTRLDQRLALFRFAERVSVSLGKFQHLSRIAEPEEWDYRESPTNTLPILSYYLHKTFDQLYVQEKVLYDEGDPTNSKRACFNTGLVTELQEEILGVFVRNPKSGETPLTPPWVLEGFFPSSDRHLASFAQTEFPLATYFTTLTELFLDPKTRISLRLDHIILDNLDRFPARLRHPDAARGALERAFRDAQRRLARNYKTAVPQFFHGQIHLLLPLALEEPTRVDRALVLHRHDKIYWAATIYYLDWAYREARVLAKPDKEWLHPVRTPGSVEPQIDQDDAAIDDAFSSPNAQDILAENPVRLSRGDVVTGRVSRIEGYGAFLEIAPDIQALCHISELAIEFVEDVSAHVRIGDELQVKILKVDGRKVSVSRKAVLATRR